MSLQEQAKACTDLNEVWIDSMHVTTVKPVWTLFRTGFPHPLYNPLFELYERSEVQRVLFARNCGHTAVIATSQRRCASERGRIHYIWWQRRDCGPSDSFSDYKLSDGV